jgi:hypothetical protein
MATLSSLIVSLLLDASRFDADLRSSVERLQDVGRRMQTIGAGMTSVGRGMTMGLTLPIIGAGVAAVKAASDLEETVNKVNVVFGESAAEVQAWADTAATSLGQSRQQALDAAGTFGNLFTSMEMGPKAAADMSTGLVTLATDLASFNNIDPTEATMALRAGLVGEVEPLRRLGVNLNAATIAAKAMELGLVDLSVDMTAVQGLTLDLEKAQIADTEAIAKWGEGSIQARDSAQKLAEIQERLNEATLGAQEALTPAQRAQAAYALIMEQTTNAQGDFIRTSDSLANSQRTLKAQLVDAAGAIGTDLLPIAKELVVWLQGLIEKFTALDPAQRKTILTILGIAAAAGPLLIVIGSIVGAIGTLLPVLGAVAGVLTGPVGLAILAIVAIIALFAAAWKNNWGGIRDVLTAIWEGKIKPFLNQMAEIFRNVIMPVIRAVADVVGAVLGLALRILAGLWTNVLWPALQKVWSFLVENILPILQRVAGVVMTVIGPALQWLKDHVLVPLLGPFNTIRDLIQRVVDKLNAFANAVRNVKLPSWLTPGSPTPFELGLRGIVGQLRALEGGLPALSVGLAMPGLPSLAAVGVGAGVPTRGFGGGTSVQVSLQYSPLVSLADRYEAETRLAPYIEAAVRKAFGVSR